MLLYTPTVCLQRCSYMRYSQPSQSQGALKQSMALWKYSCSQAVSYHAKTGFFGWAPKKNIKSSRLQVGSHILNIKLDMPLHQKYYSVSWNSRSMAQKCGVPCTGPCLTFAVSAMANAEGPIGDDIDTTQTTESSGNSTHGKKVCTDYSVTGIPGDGRCLFRSVAHGACIRPGKSIPNEDLQRKLADDLRALVAEEFIKRRAETEWFVEGDFDTYVSQIRKPHVWGGEPELFMASHVLQMPVTVYMYNEEAGGLISIAEYGQEYGKDDPIQVLYHGFGHYDALHIPGNSEPRSRL